MGQLLGKDNRVRQAKVCLELLILYLLYKKWNAEDEKRYPRLAKWNEYLRSIQPWRLILASLTFSYLLKNLSLLLGLNAPHHSLASDPDMHYSPSFSRVRWILTSLDAGVLSTFRVKNSALRHTLTLVMGLYYLIYSRSGEKKVQKFRDSLTTEYVKAMWEKGDHPVLQAFARFTRKKLEIEEFVFLPRITTLIYPNQSHSQANTNSIQTNTKHQQQQQQHHQQQKEEDRIECSLFYSGSRSSLSSTSRLILSFPGGGFVSQTPRHHTDYLSYWSDKLGLPILSVNYRKAPQHPYPAGFNDCFDVYQQIINTNGQCIGMNTNNTQPLQLALVGDSAGGNLVTVVTLKAISLHLPLPIGVHLIYPCLDLGGEVWRTRNQQHYHHHPNLNSNSTSNSNSNSNSDPNSSTEVQTADASELVQTGSNHIPILGSRMAYAFDGVLPIKYLLLLGRDYFKNGGDPVCDMYASPVVAPLSTLANFPPTYIHCGAVDPFIDDSLRFIAKLKAANPQHIQTTQLYVIPGVSHAYMQVSTFLKEGREAVAVSAYWFAHMFNLPTPKGLHPLPNNFTPININRPTLKNQSTSPQSLSSTSKTNSTHSTPPPSQNEKEKEVDEKARETQVDPAALASSSSPSPTVCSSFSSDSHLSHKLSPSSSSSSASLTSGRANFDESIRSRL